MVEWTGKPAYQQLADELRSRIAKDEFAKTGKLPSLADIQEEHRVTATVARAAIRQLATEGLVVSHQGKGAFLTPDSPERAKEGDPVGALAELREQVAQLREEVTGLRERVTELEGR
ncbi:winged helix-turn-helix domain-containing protein [Streptomyces sp. NPDC053560]|uniref:winged helix-turn-helix domain-containing protein n=1 Tax=Streptomyces sp. NPDC053560 TaxID=3365711 RepID=UPI0037D230A5